MHTYVCLCSLPSPGYGNEHMYTYINTPLHAYYHMSRMNTHTHIYIYKHLYMHTYVPMQSAVARLRESAFLHGVDPSRIFVLPKTKALVDHIRRYVCMYVRIYVCICMPVCVYVFAYMCVYVMYVGMRMYVQIHVQHVYERCKIAYTRKHTHVCM